eukprot:1226941-Alexandrium_andersonii.AAC.1
MGLHPPWSVASQPGAPRRSGESQRRWSPECIDHGTENPWPSPPAALGTGGIGRGPACMP